MKGLKIWKYSRDYRKLLKSQIYLDQIFKGLAVMVSELQMWEAVFLKGDVICMSKIYLMAFGSSLLIFETGSPSSFGFCKILYGMEMKLCLCVHAFPIDLCPHFQGLP